MFLQAIARRLGQEAQEKRIMLEAFVGFLAMVAIFTAMEFVVFGIQDWMVLQGMTIHYPEIGLDSQVPLMPLLIWPYWAYYPFIGIAMWLPRDRRDIFRLLGGFLLMHIVGYIFFLSWPTAIVHPELLCQSVSCDMIGAIYLLDPGYGVFPSLHVADSIYLAMACFAFNFRWRWPVLAGALIISFATVAVKQHYIIDVPAGALLAWVVGRFGWKIVDNILDRGLAQRLGAEVRSEK